MPFDGRVLSGIGVLAAVVEARSFGRAATALGLTQSGVSRAIARLEAQVGARLLQRSARAVTLTDEGRRFYERVAPLLTGIEDAASEASAAATQARGVLRVAVDALVARTIVGPRIAGFLAANPELTLDMVVRDHLGDLVADGFDAAVRFGEPEPSTLVVRKVCDTRVVTCASRAYLERMGRPKHPRDIERHECILFRDPTTGRPYEWVFLRGAERVGVAVRGRLIINDSATGIAACLAGHGLAQPLEIELRALREPDLVRVLPAWSDEVFPLYVFRPSRQLVPAKVRAFIDFVVAAVR